MSGIPAVIKLSGIPATILSSVALVLGIIGWAIPYWEYYDNYAIQINVGLWQYCTGVYGSEYLHDCDRLDLHWTITSSMKIVRTLVILGSVLQAIALVFSFRKLFFEKKQQSLFLVAGTIALVSGMLMILGTVIFGAKTRHETEFVLSNEVFDLHGGFGLCIVSGCLAIFASVLYFRDKVTEPLPQNDVTTQPGTTPLQDIHQATGFSTGYSPGFPGVILQPPSPRSNLVTSQATNQAANQAARIEVTIPPPQGLPYQPIC